MQKITEVFNNISVKLSHVLLASKWDSEALIKMNELKYKYISHISKEHYFDKMIGVVYRKGMNKLVAQTFEQMYFI